MAASAPDAGRYEELTEDDDGPLPSGWKLVINGSHRFYYHAATDVSQWQRPSGRSTPKQDPLPPGWEQVKDGDDIYYYCVATDESTWDRPAPVDPTLPAGWRRCTDAEGDVFYHNDETGQSTWKRPGDEAPAAAAGAGGGAGAGTGTRDGTAATTGAVVTGAVGGSDSEDDAAAKKEAERVAKARAARAVAVAAINRANKSLAAKAAAGGGSTRRKSSSWRLLRAMVHTRAAFNKNLSRAKMRRLRRGVFAASTEDDARVDAEALASGEPPSSGTALAAGRKALQHYLFKNLREAQRTAMLQALRRREYKAGQDIIKQGEVETTVYVLETGCVETIKDGERLKLRDQPGTLFGELALLYAAPRTTGIVAHLDTVVWVLTAATFRRLSREAAEQETQDRIHTLRAVPDIVAVCEESKNGEAVLRGMASELSVVSFTAGQEVVKSGDSAEAVYVVTAGTVEGSESGTVVATGEAFGVEALDSVGDTPAVTSETLKAGAAGTTCFQLLRSSYHIIIQSVAEASGEGAAGSTAEDVPRVELSEMEELGQLGRGSFGMVKMVRWRGRVMALKRLSKHHIFQARQVKHVIRERRLLGRLRHPFVVNLEATAIDSDSLYMLLELVQGGELWSLIYGEKSPLTKGEGGMPDAAAMFYTACIIQGLEHLHGQGVAFRDLKPENLLVTKEGYLKFVDFGFAKRIPFLEDGELRLKSQTMLGSPDYLSPELILRNGHDQAADLWALGVIVYEMLEGAPAFDEENRNTAYERACRCDVQLSADLKKRSPLGCDLISKLLVADPRLRLGDGEGGMAKLKAHPWFAPLDWEQLAARTFPAPMKPTIGAPDDRSNFEVEGEDDEEEEDDADLLAPFTGDQSVWAGF